jgi:hypothetical protein
MPANGVGGHAEASRKGVVRDAVRQAHLDLAFSQF